MLRCLLVFPNNTFNVIRLLTFYRYLDIVYMINAFSFLALTTFGAKYHSTHMLAKTDPPCSMVSVTARLLV